MMKLIKGGKEEDRPYDWEIDDPDLGSKKNKEEDGE